MCVCLPTGSVAIVDLLAAQGADVGAATHMGDTPLQLAARAGHERLVARLLQPPPSGQLGHAHVHATDRLGWTALHCACQHGSLSVASLLLQVAPAYPSPPPCAWPACAQGMAGMCSRHGRHVLEARPLSQY